MVCHYEKPGNVDRTWTKIFTPVGNSVCCKLSPLCVANWASYPNHGLDIALVSQARCHFFLFPGFWQMTRKETLAKWNNVLLIITTLIIVPSILWIALAAYALPKSSWAPNSRIGKHRQLHLDQNKRFLRLSYNSRIFGRKIGIASGRWRPEPWTSWISTLAIYSFQIVGRCSDAKTANRAARANVSFQINKLHRKPQRDSKPNPHQCLFRQSWKWNILRTMEYGTGPWLPQQSQPCGFANM